MLLSKFLDRFEFNSNQDIVHQYLAENINSQGRVEFLGHYLSSVFQPIITLNEMAFETVGFEAFLRASENETEIPTEQYFQEIDSEFHSFADQLCADLHVRNFFQQAKPHERVHLNISSIILEQHLSNFQALENQIQIAQKHGLDLKRITVEISMSQQVDAGVVYSFASRLHELGLYVTLEGFDADCASFSRILYTNPDAVKFNSSWLRGNLECSEYQKIVSGVVECVQATGAKTHQEQIETQRELNFAIDCGFDLLQGYIFGTPSTDLLRPAGFVQG